MYVITFYSFKGGVGRTMALVNVAAELVRRGRKVLVVDFDLEAPGLETYKRLRPEQPHPGIVEYVTEFRRTQEVPDIREYVYETNPIGKRGGRLWVMPAGRRDGAYRNALTDLDWKRLYEDEGGFLLFEDTKKGWEKELKSDYVLIDSRTGDTDVLGICTRQLPDSVVLMFMPNEQNLAGLKNVVRDIRREETEGLKKKIHLHFVASNVSRLDDEEGILQTRLREFQQALEFPSQGLDGLIDRYDSILHLDQRIFALERPRSKLARQYRRLVRHLTVRNLNDRGAQLSELIRLYRPIADSAFKMGPPFMNKRLWRQRSFERNYRIGTRKDSSYENPGCEGLEKDLKRITDAFPADQEMLGIAAEMHWVGRNFAEASSLLDQSISLGANPEAQLLRSMIRIQLGRKEEALADLLAVIHLPSANDWLVLQAFKLLHDHEPRRLEEVSWDRLRAMPTDAKWQVADYLATPVDSFSRAVALLQDALSEKKGDTIILDHLSKYLLYRREWNRVIDLLPEPINYDKFDSHMATTLFHVAMAHWALDGELPENLCRRFVEFEVIRKGWRPEDYQALALAYWRLGDRTRAKKTIQKMLGWWGGNMGVVDSPSYWRCLEASSEELREDCRQIERLIDGEPLQPLFLAGPPLSESDEANTI